MCLLCSLSLQLHLPPTSLRCPLITRTDRQRDKEGGGEWAFVSQMHFSELSKSLNCIARPNAQRQRQRQRGRGRGSERERGRGCARLGRGAIRSNTFKRITPELSHTHINTHRGAQREQEEESNTQKTKVKLALLRQKLKACLLLCRRSCRCSAAAVVHCLSCKVNHSRLQLKQRRRCCCLCLCRCSVETHWKTGETFQSSWDDKDGNWI